VDVEARVTRRSLLIGAVASAAFAAGCAGKDDAAPDTEVSDSMPGAITETALASDRQITASAMDDEQSVLALYVGVARRVPQVRQRLAPVIAAQRRHVDALAAALGLDAPPPPPAATGVLRRPLGRAIAEAAGQAARARLADCGRVESGSLASMLASMAASHRVVAALWDDR
jgi:hypothetical protein